MNEPPLYQPTRAGCAIVRAALKHVAKYELAQRKSHRLHIHEIMRGVLAQPEIVHEIYIALLIEAQANTVARKRPS